MKLCNDIRNLLNKAKSKSSLEENKKSASSKEKKEIIKIVQDLYNRSGIDKQGRIVNVYAYVDKDGSIHIEATTNEERGGNNPFQTYYLWIDHKPSKEDLKLITDNSYLYLSKFLKNKQSLDWSNSF
jgi:hypothetical protein